MTETPAENNLTVLPRSRARWILAAVVALVFGGLALLIDEMILNRQTVRYTLASDAAFDDLDRLLGERQEIEKAVRGPRIRIDGIATISMRELNYLEGDGVAPFRILTETKWPNEVVGHRVSVEGRLRRQWHTSVRSVPASPWPWNSEVKNQLVGIGTGFAYYLDDCVYELAD
jgi:hypothetical protein